AASSRRWRAGRAPALSTGSYGIILCSRSTAPLSGGNNCRHNQYRNASNLQDPRDGQAALFPGWGGAVTLLASTAAPRPNPKAQPPKGGRHGETQARQQRPGDRPPGSGRQRLWLDGG